MANRQAPLTLQDCEKVYDLPVAEAATALGVSRPTIAKVLRRHGIARWPYRKRRAQQRLAAWNTLHHSSHTRIPRRKKQASAAMHASSHDVPTHDPTSEAAAAAAATTLVPFVHEEQSDAAGVRYWGCDEQLGGISFERFMTRDDAATGHAAVHGDDSQASLTAESPGRATAATAAEDDGGSLCSREVDKGGIARAVVGMGNWSRGLFGEGDGGENWRLEFCLRKEDSAASVEDCEDELLLGSSLSFNEGEFC